MSLSSLSVGSAARLVSIGGDRAFRCRLMELGLLPGIEVRVTRKADLGGLMEVEVRGARLSVRQDEARLLTVDPHGA
jgi:Fe2+ transport system protein FeoA